jgi:hypothetical protein
MRGTATGCAISASGGAKDERIGASAGFGAGAGGSSTVLCLPVVQGGIERNSSKVRTRGLQHFQPRYTQS